ncbi:MAG: N-6 DNA methylase [Actinobacteria bacterium]|nr:N-6 DNA methylase [Cyanobacteriota bacterium]MCL5770789.1 N-6 DNA methylase [Actinomycetota bacterium]
MARSTVHYTDNETNNILKRLHNKLRPAGTPVQRVEYIIELLLLRIFEIKLKQDEDFIPLRSLFEGENYQLLFSHLVSIPGEQIKIYLNKNIFPFYAQILSKARSVFKENLPQKVQDNLVLIEEVFANSSFSTNVQSGNMTEIIGLVSDIDENTILRTDILGDAIESALSETGGTQDIGLFRTPEHIRQMMVALANPTFEDTIFDPACGTGGFLFDAYHYVLEKITKDGKWPSSKFPPSHPELNEYFKKYFIKFNEPIPDIDTANRFYREGVSGIEYLGMIRKMAAINLYIRGLNPANIIQGDSLQRFNPALDMESKTLILSNPPFGAERDQPAYPNIWQEYAKESETTILFVKLMFDLLKKGGRCAVVVSEGFLTWDKASARAMRKILLEEANLRAIISVPQGVFVSKQGQGAKTSILYFEKGEPTKWVWYYKIENDGFSMGVNRKPIEGCQIPEIIELFHNYVKQGKIPPETKNSFIIPAEWIKTLDPRLKERIKQETKKVILLRNKGKRDKLVEELEEKKQRGKITDEIIKEKLWQFDNVLENKIKNEISKQIEKSHLYSFNLQTYRSDLTDEQIKEWQKALKNIEPKNNSTLDEKYQMLKTADEKLALQLIASLNPKSAIEMDIAHEFVGANHELHIFRSLNEILKKRHRYPKEKLENLLIPKYEKIAKEDYKGDFEIIEKIDFAKGQIYFRKEKLTGMDLYKANTGDLITSKINLYQGAITIAPIDLVCSTHYQVYEINTQKILPKYMFYVLRSKKFLEPIAEQRSQGIKNEQGPKFLLDFSIPLPPLEVQQQIVEQIERQKAIIEGAEKILENWEVDINRFYGEQFEFREIFKTQYGYTASGTNYGEFRLIRITDINRYGQLIEENKMYVNTISEADKQIYMLKKGDILIARTGATFGKMLYFDKDEKAIFGSYLIRLIPKIKINSKYIWYYSFSMSYWKQAKELVEGGTQPQFNANKIIKIKIPIPPLEIQKQIIEELDKEMGVLEKVKFLKQKAEKRIEEILEKAWGE